MNSLFAKILLWFWFALAITVVGSAFISAFNVNENASDESAPVSRLVRFQLEEATSAYEIGGRPALQSFLDTLHRVYDARAVLAAERRLLLDISHELRSPLARLGVAIELARGGDDTDTSLNRIQKEADRLNSLVSQLLQVTRAEGDPASLHRDPVRLDQLVGQV